MSGRAWEPARTPHDCPTCGALPGHQRPELAPDLAAHDAQVRAEALAPIEALADAEPDYPFSYATDPRANFVKGWESAHSRIRAAMEAKG